MSTGAYAAALLRWGAEGRRDLPWRTTRDPWAVLVSEVMLQQTQVARVAPRYRAFLRRFPTPARCAAASLDEVLRAWAGLGYNRRAVQLHRAATAVVEGYGGALPRTLEALLQLPGVGRYTARAVMTFAFEHDVGVVEANSSRVLARAFAGRRLGAAEAQHLADSLVPGGRSWEWNSTMLDLGATVCTRRGPACGHCPLRPVCAWAAAGRPPPDPADGSAGAGRRQSTFEGSDRQGRGRLVAALRRGPVALDDTAAAAGFPDEPSRAAKVLDALVADGVVSRSGAVVVLGGGRVQLLGGQRPERVDDRTAIAEG